MSFPIIMPDNLVNTKGDQVMLEKIKETLIRKPSFIAIGLFNIVLFHYAIFRLFMFLYDSSERNYVSSPLLAMIINISLLVFFSWPHSFLLDTHIKKKILKVIPVPLYSTLYSIHACVGIVLMDQYWVDLGKNLYIIDGPLKAVFQVAYALSWIFMFWAMLSTGLFRQSGIEEWFKHLQGKKMKYSIATHGAYGLCRHPIYAAFIAMMWTTPNMTYDHLLLSLGWTFYIFWGAGQKEKRLMRNKGYKQYSENVTSFPFIGKYIDELFLKYLWRI